VGKAKTVNWQECTELLFRRGDVTLWLGEDVVIDWQRENNQSKVGAPYIYSNDTILSLLSM